VIAVAMVCVAGLTAWWITSMNSDRTTTARHKSFVAGVRVAERHLSKALDSLPRWQIGTWAQQRAYSDFATEVQALDPPADDVAAKRRLVAAAQRTSRAYTPDCQSENWGGGAPAPDEPCFYVNWTRAQQRAVDSSTAEFDSVLHATAAGG
jgi:hypothetical protein